MKHVIEAGTDGATLCAFDAAALPDDFDARVGEGPVELMETLRRDGVLWFGGTGGDGSHIVHLFVDEDPLPGSLGQRAWEGKLAIPSGQLWVCGAEYMATDPERGSYFTPPGGLDRYAMGQRIEVPPGRYELQAYEVDVVDKRDPATTNVTTSQWLQVIPLLLFGLGGLAAFFSGGAFLVSLLIKVVQVVIGNPLAAVGWEAVIAMFIVFCAGIGVIALGRLLGTRINRLPSVVRDNAAYDAARKETPDIVLVLKSSVDTTGTIE